jgi:hypothetical protein
MPCVAALMATDHRWRTLATSGGGFAVGVEGLRSSCPSRRRSCQVRRMYSSTISFKHFRDGLLVRPNSQDIFNHLRMPQGSTKGIFFLWKSSSRCAELFGWWGMILFLEIWCIQFRDAGRFWRIALVILRAKSRYDLFVVQWLANFV